MRLVILSPSTAVLLEKSVANPVGPKSSGVSSLNASRTSMRISGTDNVTAQVRALSGLIAQANAVKSRRAARAWPVQKMTAQRKTPDKAKVISDQKFILAAYCFLCLLIDRFIISSAW